MFERVLIEVHMGVIFRIVVLWTLNHFFPTPFPLSAKCNLLQSSVITLRLGQFPEYSICPMSCIQHDSQRLPFIVMLVPIDLQFARGQRFLQTRSSVAALVTVQVMISCPLEQATAITRHADSKRVLQQSNYRPLAFLHPRLR